MSTNATRRSSDCYQAVGVMAMWTGNENALFVGNFAINFDGAAKLTRGEEWSAPVDLAHDDFSGQPGYVAFNTPSLEHLFIRDGDVAWLTGAGFAKNYEKYLDSGGQDILGFKLWHRFPDGCAMSLGPARSMYDLGGRSARAAVSFYESRVGRGADPHQAHIQAARMVYEGLPGVSRPERRIADAFWYHVTADYEMYSRTQALAERFDDISERVLKEEVQKKLDFYSAPRQRDSNTRMFRALLEENRQLRAISATRRVAEIDNLSGAHQLLLILNRTADSSHSNLLMDDRLTDAWLAVAKCLRPDETAFRSIVSGSIPAIDEEDDDSATWREIDVQ